MNEKIIDGVEIKQLKTIADERGYLMEILRNDDKMFLKFGQGYITTSYPGVVKAWHMHQIQTDFQCVVKGMGKIVLFDDRPNSPTKGVVNEFFAGERNNILIKIPVGVWHGVKCIGEEMLILVNFVTETYNREKPDEYRLPYDTEKIPYDWALKNF